MWDNFDRGRAYRPNAETSVHTTEVKILSYRFDQAWLIRCLLIRLMQMFVLTDIWLASGDELN